MNQLAHGSRRIQVVDGPRGTSISIPVRSSTYLRFFLPVWLCGWTAGWIVVPIVMVFAARGPEALFMLVWWIGWSAAGVFVWLSLLNQFVGREVITLDGIRLNSRNEIWRLHRDKSYQVAALSRLRFAPPVGGPTSLNFQPFGFYPGSIAAQYEGGTIRFGNGLDEDEARWVIDEITQRVPIPG